jgi:hypothetical protein
MQFDAYTGWLAASQQESALSLVRFLFFAGKVSTLTAGAASIACRHNL